MYMTLGTIHEAIKAIFGNEADRAMDLLITHERRMTAKLFLEGDAPIPEDLIDAVEEVPTVGDLIEMFDRLASAPVRRSVPLIDLLEAELRVGDESSRKVPQIHELEAQGLDYLDGLRCRHNRHAYYSKPRKKPGIPKFVTLH